MLWFKKKKKKAVSESSFSPLPPSVLIYIEHWNYVVNASDGGKIRVFHHVTPSDGGYGQEVDLAFDAEYFRTHTVEEFYEDVAKKNTSPHPAFVDREAELAAIRREFRDTGWLPEFHENGAAEKRIFYRHAEAIEDRLKGARVISKLSDDNYDCNGHDMAFFEEKSFYEGPAGGFIVHKRTYRGYGAPQERILPFSGCAEYFSALKYEKEHQDEYSDWYDMVEDN